MTKFQLMLIASFLGMTVSCASQADVETETEAMPALLTQAGEGRDVGFPLHPTTELAGDETNMAGMSLFEIEIEPNAGAAPPHTHTHEDEFFYVREGAVTFMADGMRKTLTAGGLAMLPRGGMHAIWNESDDPAILLCGTSGGKFGDFFDAVAIASRAANATTPAEVGPILGAEAAARGIYIDMTAIPADVAALYGLP